VVSGKGGGGLKAAEARGEEWKVRMGFPGGPRIPRFCVKEEAVSSIAIITATNSSLPAEVAARYGICYCCTTVAAQAAQTAGAHYRPLWDGCIGASVDREGKVVGER
jgi:hypothetical protein